MKQVSKSFPSDYRIYESISQPESCYAIHVNQVVRMETVKKKYADINQSVPDSFTVKTLKFGKVKDEGNNSIYDIIDRNPIDRKISDLIERVLFEYSKGS